MKSLGRDEVKVKAKVVVLNDSLEVNNDKIPNKVAVDLKPADYCGNDYVCVFKNEIKDLLTVCIANVAENTADLVTVLCKKVSNIVTVGVEEADNLLGVVDKPVINKLCTLVAIVSNSFGECVYELLVKNGCLLKEICICLLCEYLKVFVSNAECILCLLKSVVKNNKKILKENAAKLCTESAEGSEVILKVAENNLELLNGLIGNGLVVNEILYLSESSLGKSKLNENKLLGLGKTGLNLKILDLKASFVNCLHSLDKSGIELRNSAVVSETGMSGSVHFLVVLCYEVCIKLRGCNKLGYLFLDSLAVDFVNLVLGNVILNVYVNSADSSCADTEEDCKYHRQGNKLETNLS